jgi:TatD DNase family protein
LEILLKILKHDVHIHLDLFQDINSLLSDIDSEQIYSIAVTNHPAVYDKLVSTVTSPYIRVALGLHPELVYKYKEHIPLFWERLDSTKYIGEVGLDFKSSPDLDKVVQLDFFMELVERCGSVGGKILSIHSRFAEKEVISILDRYSNNTYILHWFCGTILLMNSASDIGCYFSINYSMLNSDRVLKMIKSMPINRLLVESDSPFVMIKGSPYNPSIHDLIVDRLALILSIDKHDLEIILSENFRSMLTRIS